MHYLTKREGVDTPFGGLILLLLPNDISSVDWMPCVFSFSTSYSLAYFQYFLPTFLDSCLIESSSEEPELLTDLFFVVLA